MPLCGFRLRQFVRSSPGFIQLLGKGSCSGIMAVSRLRAASCRSRLEEWHGDTYYWASMCLDAKYSGRGYGCHCCSHDRVGACEQSRLRDLTNAQVPYLCQPFPSIGRCASLPLRKAPSGSMSLSQTRLMSPSRPSGQSPSPVVSKSMSLPFPSQRHPSRRACQKIGTSSLTKSQMAAAL
jgi:hypothetical protein